jgi:hypothetical protein
MNAYEKCAKYVSMPLVIGASYGETPVVEYDTYDNTYDTWHRNHKIHTKIVELNLPTPSAGKYFRIPDVDKCRAAVYFYNKHLVTVEKLCNIHMSSECLKIDSQTLEYLSTEEKHRFCLEYMFKNALEHTIKDVGVKLNIVLLSGYTTPRAVNFMDKMLYDMGLKVDLVISKNATEYNVIPFKHPLTRNASINMLYNGVNLLWKSPEMLAKVDMYLKEGKSERAVWGFYERNFKNIFNYFHPFCKFY